MPVNDTHQAVKDNQKRWELVQDCTGGSSKIKNRAGGTDGGKGQVYLPKPNPDDTSPENTSRYAAYLLRANFVNYTGHTKKGMLGLVFRKELKCDLPPHLDYLKTDSNGGGLSLEQSIKNVLGNVLETGRFGLLVDYPSVEAGLTKAVILARGIKANILSYDANSVINWRTTVIDGVKKLSLVVLKEKQETIDIDGFGSTFKDVFRVLKLDDNNKYIVEIYGEDNRKIGNTIEPTKANGSRWDEIPFTFTGAINNDETVDDAPLYDIAEINLSHYRNSADFEDSCFMVGQPTLILAGLTQNWVDEVLKGVVLIGSRSAIPLPEGATASMLQAEPNSMPMEGMNKKEEQMLKVGARLIEDSKTNETATGAEIRFAGQNSDLASIVGNVEDAFTNCFEWANEFMVSSESKYDLGINKEFYSSNLDAQQVMSLIMLADRGDISQLDVRDNLRRSGIISSDKTDEDIEKDVANNSIPIGNEDDDDKTVIDNKDK